MKELLGAARVKSGLSASEVGRRLGISRSSVSAWENPKKKSLPSSYNLQALADLYDVSVDNLVGRSLSNVSPGPDAAGVVPVVSLMSIIDNGMNAEKTHEEYIYCPISHGPETIASRVEGESMVSGNPLEKSYPPGSYIYCDPGMKEPKSGQNIIAMLSGSSTITFKQFVEEDGHRWLRPLNREYPAIHEPFIVLAIVIGLFRPE